MTAVRDTSVIWHDVECGGYDTDLPLWRELVAAHPGRVLEVGCGTGRVALDLAQRGHHVVAVDTDRALVEALRERAGSREVELTAAVGDARELAVEGEFGLIAAPMQVLQLLAGAGERHAALKACRARLAPGGVAAVAIVEGVPAGTRHEERPLPDVTEVDGWVYSSLPLDITAEGERILVTRLRQIVSPSGGLEEEVDEVRLAVLDADTLASEARAAGLRLAGRREVPATASHVGSTVLLLEADDGS